MISNFRFSPLKHNAEQSAIRGWGVKMITRHFLKCHILLIVLSTMLGIGVFQIGLQNNTIADEIPNQNILPDSLANRIPPKPATAPATTQIISAIRVAKIRLAFAMLRDDQYLIRDRGFHDLLRIDSNDLPALLDVVKQNQPIDEETASALHTIVTHVFLTGVECPRDLFHRAFLGIRFDGDQDYFPQNGGFEVRHRLPGFCAFRELDDGDFLVGYFLERELQPLRYSTDIMQAISSFRGGEKITFKVIRMGREMLINVILDTKPEVVANANSGVAAEDFSSTRNNLAEEYWDETFSKWVFVGRD